MEALAAKRAAKKNSNNSESTGQLAGNNTSSANSLFDVMTGKQGGDSKAISVIAKRMHMQNLADVNYNIYRDDFSERDKYLITSFTNGLLTIGNIEFPENHPEGKYLIKISDFSEGENRPKLAEVFIPITIGQVVDDKKGGVKKKK